MRASATLNSEFGIGYEMISVGVALMWPPVIPNMKGLLP